MRILYIANTSLRPDSGAEIRSCYLRRALLQVGEVDTLLVRAGPGEHEDVDWDAQRVRELVYANGHRRYGSLASILHRRHWVTDVLRRGRYDAVVVRYVSLSMLVPLLWWRRLIIDADDMLRSVPAAPPSSKQLVKLRNFLATRIVACAAGVWVVNPRDRCAVRGEKAACLGNVFHAPADNRRRLKPVPGRILMVGLIEHPPNLQGLQWFIEKVLPQLLSAVPEAELHVVGRFPSWLKDAVPARVVLRGFVKDVSAEYDQASLVIAPVHAGGGTQIKVVEALAYARPLVTTSFAWAGFSQVLKHGEHLAVADEPGDWVARCLEVLLQPKYAEAMGARGAAISSQFHPSAMVATVRDTLQRVIPQQVASRAD